MLAVPFLRVLVKIAGAEKELVEIGIFHTCGQTEFPDLFPETSGSVCERTEEGANHAAIGVFPIKDFTIGAIAGRGRNQQLIDVHEQGEAVLGVGVTGITNNRPEDHGQKCFLRYIVIELAADVGNARSEEHTYELQSL